MSRTLSISIVVILSSVTSAVAQPEVPPPVEPAVVTAGYDKGFVLRSDDGAYEMKLTGRMQLAFLGTSVAAGDERAQAGNFELHRVRLGLEGKLGKKLGYKAQTEYGKGLIFLKDFYVDVRLADAVWLRAGQWKRPFSRQQINSSGRLELVERALTDRAFGAGRDIGFGVHNNYEKSPEIEWFAGVFNGSSDRPALTGDVIVDPMTGEGEIDGGAITNVTPIKPVIVGRIGVNSGEIKGYGEADLEGGPLRYGAGASVLIEADWDRDGAASHKAEADFILKNNGVSASGGLYIATAGTGLGSDQSLDLFGVHLQVGYVAGKKTGVAGRYGMTTGIGDGMAETVHEILAGPSIYFRGHDGKLQLDAGARKTGAAGIADDLRLQIQGQVTF